MVSNPDRDREGPHGPTPPTPPYVRVRIRRFGKLSSVRRAEPFDPPYRRQDLGRSSGPSRLHLYVHRRSTPCGVNWPSCRDTAIYTATLSVRAFSPTFPAMRFLAVSALSGQCLNRAGRLPGPTMPSADFCRAIGVPHDTLSHESVTHGRSPEVSLATFDARPPDLQPHRLMDMDFVVGGPLVPLRLPRYPVFVHQAASSLSLLSDDASRRRPCESLALHLHQVGRETFTPKRPSMLGTQDRDAAAPPQAPEFIALTLPAEKQGRPQ